MWFLSAGVWLGIGHIITAVGCFITIIGIPFGLQHLKLALLTLAPVGKTIVSKDDADAAKREVPDFMQHFDSEQPIAVVPRAPAASGQVHT